MLASCGKLKDYSTDKLFLREDLPGAHSARAKGRSSDHISDNPTSVVAASADAVPNNSPCSPVLESLF